MEKNTERKTLSYSKGITNVPSDLLSEDTELAECEGFIYKDGEMKPIQEPVKIGRVSGKLMYVHKGADYENLICYDESNSILRFYKREENRITILITKTLKGIKTINSVGNTLICITTSSTYYFLYKANNYTSLGSEMPTPSILTNFRVSNDYPIGGSQCLLQGLIGDTKVYNFYFDDEGNLVGIYKGTDQVWGSNQGSIRKQVEYFDMPTETDNYNAVQSAVQGHVSERIKLCKEKKRFMFPFFIRVALKLYDGSYTKISNPIICYPTINRNECLVPAYYENGNWNEIDENHDSNASNPTLVYNWFWFPYHADMVFQPNVTGDYWNWADIIKEFVVFATPAVLPFKLEDTWSPGEPQDIMGKTRMNAIQAGYDVWVNKTYNFGLPSLKSGTTMPMGVIQPTYKMESEIIEELLTKTQFYKLFSVDFASPKCGYSNEINTFYPNYASNYIKDGVLENLEEQEQLQVDDYYGWTTLVPESMYTYNGRLNAFGLKRYPFKGFNYFTGSYCQILMDAEKKTYPNVTFYTYIESETMKGWVKSNTTDYMPATDGWFYYPDPNAKKVLIYENNTGKGVAISLKKHSMLNGAYSFQRLPDTSVTGMTFYDAELPTIDETMCESLDSQIYTSNANNPFVFEASGDNTVGTGKILGIIANTTAISQGQFGQYPMLAFTSEGIYAMGLNSEGVFTNIHPMSREVCNEKSPFVPTDSQVFFTSEKGLMSATGAQVVCCSNQMRGRKRSDISGIVGEFMEDMKDCLIAYDYRDSLLRIFCADKDTQFVYNMTDGTFATDNSGIIAQAVVNDYPDNLIQDKDGNVYSLTEKPDINEDKNSFDGSVITRPLKLGGSIYLKSLRAVKHLVDTNDGKLKFHVYGSNNGKTWQKLASLKGKPWKYFQFIYDLSGFKACDSFAGSIVDVQTRRDDKIR